MHISMYDGETNLDHRLDADGLAMRAGGSDDDFTVQYLPLLLSSSTRAWLEQLVLAASAARAISAPSSWVTPKVHTPSLETHRTAQL
jgi:hypothetical protein